MEALARLGNPREVERAAGSLDDSDLAARRSVERLLDDWEES